MGEAEFIMGENPDMKRHFACGKAVVTLWPFLFRRIGSLQRDSLMEMGKACEGSHEIQRKDREKKRIIVGITKWAKETKGGKEKKKWENW